MIKVTVSSTELRHIKGVSKVSQKPFDFHTQTVYFHTLDKQGNPNPYPEKGEVIVERDPASQIATAYPAGEYVLHPGSLYVNRNGGLEVAPKLAQPRAR